jgi:XTP/dITP diphosphohydrolase
MSRRGNRKSFQLKGRVIFFATNNVNKFHEARRVLAEYNVAVGMLRVKSLEVQSESLEEIATASALDAFEKCRLPIIVEDAGLFVDALNGFPGPYAAYAYKTVGNQGLLRLMKNVKARSARFESVVAHFSAELESPVCFHGEVLGEIAEEERKGNSRFGFGFDPIFKPAKSSKTFAEMTIAQKNEHSHRARALRKFAEWYKS